jgi:SAM-dependent methyltransferase
LNGKVECLLCAARRVDEEAGAHRLAPLYPSIEDYEYGVQRQSRYFECGECGFVMQLPRVSADEIPSLYPADYQAHSKPGKSIFAVLKQYLIAKDARRVIAVAGSSAPRILEIGCGNGSLLKRILVTNPKAYVCGIDIVDLGISANSGIDFRLGQLEQVELSDESFDVIYCSNLIEHVVDPIKFMMQLRKLLRPGGMAIIITPNHLSLDRFVFGRRWGGYHFPRHVTLFNHRNIRKAIELSGLQVRRISGAYAWWAISIGNCLQRESARRGRGLAFAAITAAFLPLDIALNLIRPHGSMTALAQRPA